MTEEALAALLDESVTVALDSNAVFGVRLLDLADAVNRVNEGREDRAIQLVIPAIVHGEHLAQQRRKHGLDFNAQTARQALASKGFDTPDGLHCVAPFAPEDGDHHARLLAERFPTQEAWEAAKRQRCAAMLGCAVPGESRRCAATSDWLIRTQAEGRGWLLVTDDRGEEFADLERRTTLGALRTELQRRLAR